MPRAYVPRPCRGCGQPKGGTDRRFPHSWYCDPCTKARREHYARLRAPCGQCAEDWNCIACARIKKQRQKEAAARGAATRRKNQTGYFRPENAERYWQHRCHSAVSAAVKRGLLPNLKSGEYACTDCGRVAHEYDHRDYSRPLDVDPVCRSCNKQRGTATWPTADRYQFKKIKAA